LIHSLSFYFNYHRFFFTFRIFSFKKFCLILPNHFLLIDHLCGCSFISFIPNPWLFYILYLTIPMSMELDHLELWSAVFNTFSYSAGSRVDYPRLRTHCLMLICVSVMGTNCRNSLTKSLLVFCQKPGCITHWGLFQSLLGLESRFDSPPNLLSGFISPYLCSYL
jgi:hypothetical protein